MAKRSRVARFRGMSAPWIASGLASGLAMSIASAIWTPLANVASTATDGRMRGSAKANAQIRSAVRLEHPEPGKRTPRSPPDMPLMVQRPCRPGDAPAGVPCTLNLVDMP